MFHLDETHQAAVLEMGMSRRGELSRLAAIARPDVGVVTRVAPAHLEFFSGVEEIALAKRELIEGLNGKESVAVLNADDPLVAAMAFHAPGRVLTYGIENAADFRAESIVDRGALGSKFVLTQWDKQVPLELSLAGRHVIANALAALAAASVWGITAEESREVLRSLRAPAMRGELLKFANGSAVINDSYNSSPAALHAMIAVLAATPDYKRRILAAGEMRELGATSPELHREAGAFAAQTGKIDWVFGVAGDGAQIVEGAVAAGVPRSQTKVFASSEEAAEFFAGVFAAGRSDAGEGLARREDGARRGGAGRATWRRRWQWQRQRCFGPRGRKGAPLDALLHSLPVAAALLQPAECFSLHHGSHRLCELDRDVSGVCVRAVADPEAARDADRAVHSRRRAGGASEKEGHADDGWRADRALDAGADAALGGFDEWICAAGDVCAAGVCGDWVCR